MNNEQVMPAKPEEGGTQSLLWELIGTARTLEDRLESRLGEIGLSSAKLGVLNELAAEHEPVPLSELAARIKCVRSNVTQLVDRLEADGLVRRVGSPSDRRSVLAELTPLGREKQAAGARKVAALQRELAAVVRASDRGALERSLAAIAR